MVLATTSTQIECNTYLGKWQGQEVIPIEKKKMGRPTDNPRPNKLSIRISDTDKKILEDYCERENVNKTEAISRGIKTLDKK